MGRTQRGVENLEHHGQHGWVHASSKGRDTRKSRARRRGTSAAANTAVSCRAGCGGESDKSVSLTILYNVSCRVQLLGARAIAETMTTAAENLAQFLCRSVPAVQFCANLAQFLRCPVQQAAVQFCARNSAVLLVRTGQTRGRERSVSPRGV